MIELGVNIDHVATVRQARRTYEPDPVWAAVEAHLGGADGITVHLREDRRHIQDEDVRRLRELTHIKLNLEMARDRRDGRRSPRRIKPEMAMLVPEGRQEVTTEGGLDIVGQEKRLKAAGREARRRGHRRRASSSTPTSKQVEAAERIGARVCEIHTGPYAHAFHSKGRDAESAAGAGASWRRSARRARRSARSACASTPATRSTTSTSSRWRRCPACASCTSATPS